MTDQKHDPFIDFAYVLSLLAVLMLFIVLFTGLSGYTPEGVGAQGKNDLSEVAGTAGFMLGRLVVSLIVFGAILLGTVFFHELGHALGGMACGYRIAHFCVFGIVISFGRKKKEKIGNSALRKRKVQIDDSARKKKKVQIDDSAYFGGYVIACTDEKKRSPLVLLRMGPWAECFFILTSAFLSPIVFDPVCAVFVTGEMLAYLYVRTLSLRRDDESDSCTSAQVMAEGPGDYNRLMDIYDMHLTESVKSKRVREKRGDKSMTVKEELAFYDEKGRH